MYIKQLDGLRCFAVMAVLVSHTFFYPVVKFFALGKTGVDIFFTLSGFLITGILLNEKKKIEDGRSSLKKSILFFYAKRFLRIFPLYYAVIFTAYIFNYYPARDCFPWLITFSSNWEIAHSFCNQPFLNFTHFWSLAVEEQFYIFFPFVILFANKERDIQSILFTLVLLGIAARVFFICYAKNVEYATYFSTPACIDALSIGALLALRKNETQSIIVGMDKRLRRFFTVILFLLFITTSSIFKETGCGIVIGRTFTALFTCWLIVKITSRTLPAFVSKLLSMKPLTYAGKISFGIYVFHPFIISFVTAYFKENMVHSIPVTPVIFVAVFVIAKVSWELFEKKVLQLKKKFIT